MELYHHATRCCSRGCLCHIGVNLAFIRALRDDEGNENSLLTITFAGPWLSQLHLDALELVLFYICGTGGTRRCVEMYDRNARFLSRHFPRVSHAYARIERLLMPPTRYTDIATWNMLSNVVHRAAYLIKSGFPLRPVLYHLFSGLQPTPEIRIAHLSIALDAIKTATIRKIKGEGKAIADQNEFKRRIKPALLALENEFSSAKDQEALELIKKRLEGANDWSERERWKRFWRDVICYEVVGKERDVLEHRDAIVHDGYILDTEYDLALDNDPMRDRRSYEDRLREIDQDARILQNIVDRVLLRLLQFTGTFLDATNNSTCLEIGSCPEYPPNTIFSRDVNP